MSTPIETMPERDFAAWLAGFFDGEGCIHIPKVPGIDLSIANTNREVIYAIYDRLKLGMVQVVDPMRPQWNIKYHWRVRRYGDAEKVIHVIYEFLTVKRAICDKALERIHAVAARQNKVRDRNAKAVALVAKGLTHRHVAALLDTTRPNVTFAVSAHTAHLRSMGL